MSSAKILWKEFRELTHPKTGLKQVHVDVEENDVFLWKVSLMVVDPESIYNGACLQGQMRFPSNYPYSPPSFRFTPAIFHPNVYPDGRLCISILHSAGQQEASDEPLNITWSQLKKLRVSCSVSSPCWRIPMWPVLQMSRPVLHIESSVISIMTKSRQMC